MGDQGQPLAAWVSTTRTSRRPGARPPPEYPSLQQRLPLDPRVVISFLISSLSLSLAFLAQQGNVVTSLSTCYIPWFSEIRHCVVEIFCQVNIHLQPHCARINGMKVQSYHLLQFHCHSK